MHYTQAMSELLMSTEKGFFAVRLKELREKAGLSQEKLAEQAGLGASTVRQFEYGMREPGFETLLKLCAGLGVTLSAFEPEPPEAKPRRKRRTEK